jgi:endonuclease/exonuclease/phosphatase family metal-dependent hydrolase
MIKRRHAVIAALIGCLGIGIAWGVHRPGEAVGDAALAITVLTMNVGDAGRRVFPVAETAACILDGGRPDILLLQEMPGGLAGAALRKALGYPYECRAESAAGKLGALMVLSAHPVLESRQIALPSARKGVGALCVVLGIAGESVLACSVHLDEVAPKTRNVEGQVVLGARELFELLWIELFTETVRTQGAKALTEAIGRDAARMPVILAGDFNTVPGSRTIRYLTGRYKDACWPSTAWFYGTYHKVAFPLSPRIC